jgi:hypothetical protein
MPSPTAAPLMWWCMWAPTCQPRDRIASLPYALGQGMKRLRLRTDRPVQETGPQGAVPHWKILGMCPALLFSPQQ